MFTLYETAGVVTNLVAGLAGARWGIKSTLLTGLTLQLAGIGMLYGWQDSWAEPGNRAKGVAYITVAQMLCGIAKDLTKLGGKTVTKVGVTAQPLVGGCDSAVTSAWVRLAATSAWVQVAARPPWVVMTAAGDGCRRGLADKTEIRVDVHVQ